MKLIIIPLFLLILVAVSVQVVNLQEPDYSQYEGTQNNPAQGRDNNSQLEALSVQTVNFNLALMSGFLALFIAVAAVGILSGLNISILGSTVQISERSQNILYNSMFYGGLWVIFSVLATIGINNIGLFSLPVIGAFFYLILTLIYVLGINAQIQHSQKG